MHIKRAWPLVFIGFLRSSTTYVLQLQRISPRLRRNAVAWSGEHLKSVEVFRKPDKLIRFFLFYDVHTKLCSMLHWQMYSLIIPFWFAIIYFSVVARYSVAVITGRREAVKSLPLRVMMTSASSVKAEKYWRASSKSVKAESSA